MDGWAAVWVAFCRLLVPVVLDVKWSVGGLLTFLPVLLAGLRLFLSRVVRRDEAAEGEADLNGRSGWLHTSS